MIYIFTEDSRDGKELIESVVKILYPDYDIKVDTLQGIYNAVNKLKDKIEQNNIDFNNDYIIVVIDNILENREYTVHELLLYIIGTLLSCYTHQQLINNEITLDDVKLQINNILRTDLNNISKYNLPIIDSRGLNFNNIDNLCKSYKKELNSLSSKR